MDESSLSSLKSLTDTLEKSLTNESLATEPDHIGQPDPKPIETVGNDHGEVLNGNHSNTILLTSVVL